MVSVRLPSDALLQHLPSYLGLSYVWRGVSLHGYFSKAHPLLLTLDEAYLFTAALPDLQCGMAPLGPPGPAQPPLLGRGVVTPGSGPWPQAWFCSSRPPPLASGTAPGLSHHPRPQTRVSSSLLFLRRRSLALSAADPDLGRGVTPLGRCPSGMGSSQLLTLTLDVG